MKPVRVQVDIIKRTWLAFAVVISLTAGCMGTPAYQPPRILAPGELHLGLGFPVTYYDWSRWRKGDLLAYPEFYGRLGLPFRLDFGWTVTPAILSGLTLELRYGYPLARGTWLLPSLRGQFFVFADNTGAGIVMPALAVGHEPVLVGAGPILSLPTARDSSLALSGFQLFSGVRHPLGRYLNLWAGAAFSSFSRGFRETSTNFGFPFRTVSLAVGLTFIFAR